MIYSKKEKIFILIITLLCSANLILNTALNLIIDFGWIKNYLAGYNYKLSNPLLILWSYQTFIFILLFIVTIKGLIRIYKRKTGEGKIFYYLSLIILIVYIVLYWPFHIPYGGSLDIWIIVDFTGLILSLFYLVYIFQPHRK